MRGRVTALAVASGLALTACGERNYDNPSVDAGARAEGAEAHPQILAEFGGAYEGPQARYMAALGEKIAAAAGLPGQCSFTLVNTDVVNAFAVPGCYIYITRGLFALVNSEAELASVLGHEVGHIVAEHSQRRERRALFSGLGAALVGLVTGSERLARLAGGAAQLYTLGYSRSQEYESDDLGIRYLAEAGYDPYAAADMLAALGAHDRLQSQATGRDEASSIPAWARTHPLTAARIERADVEARETGQAPDALPEGELDYLRAVDGLLYGDDPQQGFVLGRVFAHPAMRVAFEAPPGFTLTNTPRAVLLNGPDGVRGEFGGGGRVRGGLESYARAVITSLLGDASIPVQAGEPVFTRINGLEAVILPARVQAHEGAIMVTVAAYRAPDGQAYHFVMLSGGGSANPALQSLFGSFRFLTPQQAASLRPRQVRVVTARPGDTLQSLASLMAYDDYRMERFLTLNGRAAGQPIRPGERVKIVTFPG